MPSPSFKNAASASTPDHPSDLAAGEKRALGVVRDAEQHGPGLEAALHRRKTVGKITRRTLQQEICARRFAGEGMSLALKKEVCIDERLQGRLHLPGWRVRYIIRAVFLLVKGWSPQMSALARLARDAFALPAAFLFPPVCAGCRRQVGQPGSLCPSCWPGLRFLEEPWCPVMGTPFEHDMGEGFLSAEAIADPPPFARARSAVAYSGVARHLVQGLKYSDRTDLAPWMARWMLRPGAELVAEADVIVPVPLHWRRFLSRRYNQSAELARALARQTRKSFEPAAVARVKKTRQQVGLTSGQRDDNVRAAFKVPQEREILLRGRRVLLVDDVYTTGATVRAVTRALKKGGAAAVDVLTFARVLPGDFRADDPDTI